MPALMVDSAGDVATADVELLQQPSLTRAAPPASTTTAAKQPLTGDAAADEERICRICFGEEDRESLIAPCACRGSMKYVHADCLREWLSKTVNSDSRRTCGQCNTNYKLRRGVWAQRRRLLRVLLVAVAFWVLALFIAFFLPWNAQCLNAGLTGDPVDETWWTWNKRVLFFLPPDLIDRVEKLKWLPGKGDFNNGDFGVILNCRRSGKFHLDAALLYGSVKISGIGLNVWMAHKVLEWINNGEDAFPVRWTEFAVSFFPIFDADHLDLANLVFDYANYINCFVALVWWVTVSPWMWGYMPAERDSLISWVGYEVVGCYCVLAALRTAIEDAEMVLLERLHGGLRACDLLIYDRVRRSYH